MANENVCNNQPDNVIILGDENPKKPDDEIKLKVVEETLLTLKLDDLRSKPETKLGKMVTLGMAKSNDVIEYKIYNIKPKILDGILDYYRKGLITIPEDVCFEEMKQACVNLQIPFELKTVQDWKCFLRIQADYRKKYLVHQLIDKIILPYLIKLSENGKTYCAVELANRDKGGSEKYKPADGLATHVRFWVDAKVFNIILNDDQDSPCIINYLISKGFKMHCRRIKKLAEENHEYLYFKIMW